MDLQVAAHVRRVEEHFRPAGRKRAPGQVVLRIVILGAELLRVDRTVDYDVIEEKIIGGKGIARGPDVLESACSHQAVGDKAVECGWRSSSGRVIDNRDIVRIVIADISNGSIVLGALLDEESIIVAIANVEHHHGSEG